MNSSTFLYRIIEKLNYEALILKKRAIQTLQHSVTNMDTKQVIFVAGVQRSGTNMMMNVLERSYNTDVFHESNKRAYENYRMRSPSIIKELVRSSKSSNTVFKALYELQDLFHLLNEFSPSKAVWLIRNYEDVINSHIAIWNDMPQKIGYIIKDKNAVDDWFNRGMSDNTHNLIQKLYHQDINNATAVALLWYIRNILFFEEGLDKDQRVYLVSYEFFVNDPIKRFSELFAFLDINFTQRIPKIVFKNSIKKNPPPIIEPEIKKLCDSLAQRFENALK